MDSIIESLSNYFSDKFNNKLKRIETLDALMIKLTKKARKIKRKLVRAEDESEIQLLESQLSVLKAQKKKVRLLLAEEKVTKENNN